MNKTDNNLKQIAYETIKKKIIHCDYMPNEILSEMILMKEIDASRTPIREALNMLSQEGLIRIIPKKGIMILPLTMKEVAMTFEARMLMEPYIIENYSSYIDTDKLKELRSQTEAILQCTIQDNEHAERCCNLDDELHRTIASACRNKYLNMNLASIYDQNMRIRILGERNIWERHIIAAREHLELINYIETGDITSAVASMRVHLIHSKEAAFDSLMH
ncbi:MAG: GntR family transcriptional regulator [Coprococcus sp.]